MGTGRRVVTSTGKLVLCLAVVSVVLLSLVVPSLNSLSFARAADTQTHPRKKKQQQPPPPLPSGPTGRPVPQVPLDSVRPIAPQVSYQNGLLTIVSPNSTLGDILKAVKKLTQADIDIPDAPEHVVMRLGPGSPREVVAELLNGSRFNYVLLGSPDDANLLTRVVLVAKSGPENPPGANPGQPAKPAPQNASQPAPEMAQEASDTDAVEENADDNAEPTPPPADAAEQPANPPDANQPKTPQQLLQEMQQRQLLMQQQQQQQQQQPGQPPVPGPGMPIPQPPQQPPQQQDQ